MLFVRVKSNIGVDGGGFRYQIAPAKVGSDRRHFDQFVSQWRDAVTGSPHELFAEEEDGENEPGAIRFLRQQLEAGSRAARDVTREASEAGYSKDQIQRAKRRLHVIVEKTSMDGGWRWRLPGRDDRKGMKAATGFDRGVRVLRR